MTTKDRRPVQAPRWSVVLAVGWLVGILGVAGWVDGPLSIAIVAAGIGSLGMAGWLWGADSRDGQDWGGP